MDVEMIVLVLVSIIGALGSFISIIRLKNCHSACMDSECFKKTPASTPLIMPSLPIHHLPLRLPPQ